MGGEYVDKVIPEIWADVCYSGYESTYSAICWVIYSLVMLPYIFGALGTLSSLFLVIWLLHARPFRSIVSSSDRVNWAYLIGGFGISLVIFSAAMLTDYFINYPTPLCGLQFPDEFHVMFITLPAVYIVASTEEELWFRGYLLPALGLLTRNRIVLASVNGFLFMLAHFWNPGLRSCVLLSSFEIGFLCTVITLKSNGIELAVGIHIAFNMVSALISWSTPYVAAYSIYLPMLIPMCCFIIYLSVFRFKVIPNPIRRIESVQYEKSRNQDAQIYRC